MVHFGSAIERCAVSRFTPHCTKQGSSSSSSEWSANAVFSDGVIHHVSLSVSRGGGRGSAPLTPAPNSFQVKKHVSPLHRDGRPLGARLDRGQGRVRLIGNCNCVFHTEYEKCIDKIKIFLLIRPQFGPISRWLRDAQGRRRGGGVEGEPALQVPPEVPPADGVRAGDVPRLLHLHAQKPIRERHQVADRPHRGLRKRKGLIVEINDATLGPSQALRSGHACFCAEKTTMLAVDPFGPLAF